MSGQPGIAVLFRDGLLRLAAAHQATGAVARAEERALVAEPTHQERVVTLRAGDNADLTRVSRRGALAMDVDVAAAPALEPREVVVVLEAQAGFEAECF